jgi:hypothetical protein
MENRSELVRRYDGDSEKMRLAFNLSVDHLVAVLSGKKAMTDMAKLASVTCSTFKGLVQAEAHKEQNALIRAKIVTDAKAQLPPPKTK